MKKLNDRPTLKSRVRTIGCSQQNNTIRIDHHLTNWTYLIHDNVWYWNMILRQGIEKSWLAAHYSSTVLRQLMNLEISSLQSYILYMLYSAFIAMCYCFANEQSCFFVLLFRFIYSILVSDVTSISFSFLMKSISDAIIFNNNIYRQH